METLIVPSIQTLKHSYKKCGKEEVFRLVQESVESEVMKEIFEERLDALVESQSVNINKISWNPYVSLLNKIK